MDENSVQSSNASAIASTLTLGAMSIWRWICRFMSGLWSLASSVLVLLGLAAILMVDIATYRRQASKIQGQGLRTRPGPFPIHDKGQIYLIQPDGSRTPVSHLYASTQLKAYADVLGAAAVWEKTKL